MIIQMPNLSEESFITNQVKIGDKTYSFTFRWNIYCDVCFLVVKLNNEIILDETALVNYRSIDINHELLPKMLFRHKNNLFLEPIKETFNQYVIEYAE